MIILSFHVLSDSPSQKSVPDFVLIHKGGGTSESLQLNLIALINIQSLNLKTATLPIIKNSLFQFTLLFAKKFLILLPYRIDTALLTNNLSFVLRLCN